MPTRTTLLCWNVAGRVKRLDEQARLTIELGADLVCLQEISATTAPRWTQMLQAAGWSHVLVARPNSGDHAVQTRRPLRVLVASKAPVVQFELPDLPWPERALAVTTRGLEVFNIHSPISPSPNLAKVRTHEALHAYLAAGSGPRLVCGDLNTPRKEHPDGRVWTFARTRHGKLRPDRGERWDLAELALIKGLEPFGFRDAFRERHGLHRRELSWEWPRWGGGYRLDHLLVSSELRVHEVSYLHEWRKAGLSDHSPLFAEVSWPRAAPTTA